MWSRRNVPLSDWLGVFPVPCLAKATSPDGRHRAWVAPGAFRAVAA